VTHGAIRTHQERQLRAADRPTGPIREAADFRARYADGRMGSDPGLRRREGWRAGDGWPPPRPARRRREFGAERSPA
jgi:creatinine amidohydrolase